ncbi:Na+/Pi symporter [Serendipita sp. 401]|nr:Na+/Pi symporter [Serendipita sp. 401]
MPYLHQFDYIFALGLIFAFLDAWNIGANDVANSFATSVSSRSLTMKQAMIIASFCEFGGAVLVGARVADTIRSKIIAVDRFRDQPEVLMLGMLCALVGSSTYLTIATRLGLPVSTTHCIVGGVIGVGIATLGADGVNWGWKGVSQIFAAWAIAPGVAGALAAILFLITKYGVMKRANSLRNGLVAIPFYFALTSGILTMMIVWKGDYYRGHLTKEQLAAAGISNAEADNLEQKRAAGAMADPLPSEKGEHHPKGATASSTGSNENLDANMMTNTITTTTNLNGPWYTPKNLWTKANYYFFRGVNHDPASEQTSGKSNPLLTGNLKAMHARAEHYDNKTEYLYSFLQVMTAMTASFAHGSNDVSNAMGPLATIYLVWSTDTIASKAPVPIWILVFGGAAIVIGLWTYGYHIMRNLGNRLTLHSPSRGFSMELGAALTVVMATRLALPISTTQCIVGATVGVGLCTGDFKAINWRMVAWIYMGWFITLPVTGIISGCLMGLIINAPRWG